MKTSIKRIAMSILFALWICFSGLFLISCDKEGKGFKLTFETNGGEAISVMRVEEGENVTLPTPERAGYEFEGWYTDAEFTGEPVTTLVAESNATYYAKWAKLYTVTLDANGGTLSTTALSLKAGANIYEQVSAYVPEKANAAFGAWLLNGAELAKNAKMPESDITLTAKYKVAYTAEIWVQNTESGEYEKTDEIVGYEYAGVEFTSSQKLVGLKEVKHDNTLVKKVLSENAAENVFKHYFIRESFVVTFDPNYPDGSVGDKDSYTVIFGEGIEAPSHYEADGYCLIGWANSKTGELVYKANYIDTMLYNREGEITPADTVYPERNATLYGVWAKGYADMFGNDDYIYLLAADSDVVYLSRGGVFFQGEYLPELNEFRFLVNEEIKKGRLFESTFAYSDLDRAAKTCQLYEVGVGLVENGATIVFDEYNGLTYYDKDVTTGLTSNSTGTYVIEDGIYYVATFTEGNLAGQTITFIVGTVSEERKPAFQLRNDNEYELGTLYSFYVENCELNYHKEEGRLSLDGFGTATYYADAENFTSYKYTYADGVITLSNSNGQSVGEAYVIEIDGVRGYMVKNETYAQVYEMDGGASLTLDGLYTATYVNGNAVFEGVYEISSSAISGVMTTVRSENGETKKFLLTRTTIEVPSTSEDAKEGETETHTTYSAVEKDASYVEYYYMNAEATYYAPLLAVNDPEQGKAIMYGYTKSKTYEKVAECSYDYDETTGLYVFTVDNILEYSAEVNSSVIDYATLKAFVCALDTASTSYSVHYWYSMTTEDGTETDYRVYYTSESGAELMLVGGFAFYTVNGTTVSGPYAMSDNLMQIVAASGEVYLEINEEAKTFITLTAKPSVSYAYVNGVTNKNVYLIFDGKGGVTYTEAATEEGAEDTVYAGRVEKLTEISLSGAPIYRFISEELTFNYIALAAGDTAYFAAYDETYNGKYNSDDGILAIDGFGFVAKFTSAKDGNVYDGRYTVDEENSVINFTYGEETWFFDMDFEAREFTLRGAEATTYVLVDNQLFEGLYLEMDGYGKLTVYKMESQENAEGELESVRVDVDVNGTYTIDGDVYTLCYKIGNEEVTLVGELGTWKNSGYVFRAFLVSHKEVVQVYVNEQDWSVLILDDLGNAIKYNANGAKDTGTYTIVTDTLLYFLNDSSTDACIYVYDKATAKATPQAFTAVGYFTKDLESLLFSQYGFAIFNGGDYYYYEVVNSDYIIYRQDPTNEAANEYGFVEENFGPLASEKEYGGKIYYQNTGYAITFSRAEETKDEYPVLVQKDVKVPLGDLVFTPSGDGEFNVTCQVKLNGRYIQGQAVREIGEDGTVETYVLISASQGYYRFDIELTYTGEDKNADEEGEAKAYNTYEVVGMQWVRTIYSYRYLQTYYLYYMFYGASYAYSYENNIGMMYIKQDFTSDGTGGDMYVTSNFFEGSETYDTLGNILSIEKGDYKPYGDMYYQSEFVGEDGYTYHFYFLLQQHAAFQNTYGYRVYAMTREEVLTTEDGYEVIVEKIVGSESSMKVGNVFSVQLSKDNEAIEAESIMFKNNYVYYIVREKTEEGVITATKYYKLLLTENTSDSLEGEEETKVVPLYNKVTVTVETVKTAYTEDGLSYVDVSETEGVMLCSIDGTQYGVVESVYDAGTASYTVTLSNNKKYVVALTVVEGNEKVTITEVVESEEESEGTEEA